MYSMVTIVNTVLYTWKLLRVDLKNTHYKKEMFYNCVVIDHFTIHTSTDDVVYLKLIYVNYTSIKTNKPNLAAATWFLYMNRRLNLEI